MSNRIYLPLLTLVIVILISGCDRSANVSVSAKKTEWDTRDVIVSQAEVLGDIYKRALSSTVRIETAKFVSNNAREINPSQDRSLEGPDLSNGLVSQGQGSGFIWDNQGHIVTNHHLVGDADQVTVIFATGWEAEAKIIGSDNYSDLAILHLEEPINGMVPFEFGDSSEVRVGQLAVAIGAPFGQSFTMTQGIVSALGRMIPSNSSGFSIPEAIQTDAPINPGNSGGPLLDRLGKVIGINTQILSSTGSNAGIGFSIPINIAKRVVPDLIEHGDYQYSYLGIQGMDLRPKLVESRGLTPHTRGVVVGVVVDGGPAALAGLIPNTEILELKGDRLPGGGDLIISVDGTDIEKMSDLLSYLFHNTRPGDKISLGLIRDNGKESIVDVSLVARPESNS